MEGNLTTSDALVKRSVLVCLPNRYVSPDEPRIPFPNWLEKHPEQGKEPRNVVVVRALQEAFPCKGT